MVVIESGGEEKLKPTGESESAAINHLSNQKPQSISRSNSDSVILHKEEEEDGFEWVAVDREFDVAITDKSPEIDEVEDAFSAFQLMFNHDDEESEDQVSELEVIDWIEPPLQLCTSTRLLQPYMMDRLYDAFHLFQTDPSVQRMVMSLTSDKAVWDAVMNNEVVRELITDAESSGDEEDSGCTASFMRRLFERSAIKIIDAMERVTKYVTELFNVVVPGDETAALATGPAHVMGKLQMTVLLSIVVLLIVFVTRATRAR